ncbi:hypothetical protein [Microbacterium sp.]|uniref:hypothetical protein n=1 Tax=Microbacterium sp. TaxID=51671 RepID=UPI003F9673BD
MTRPLSPDGALALPLELMDITPQIDQAWSRRYAIRDGRGQQVATLIHTLVPAPRTGNESGTIIREASTAGIDAWGALCDVLDFPRDARGRSRGQFTEYGPDGAAKFRAAVDTLAGYGS